MEEEMSNQIEENDEIPLADILNLSVTELLIMQFLMRYQMPIVRIVLLESINSIVESAKKIASSSFYLKLNRLEANGFIKKEDDRITITAKGKSTINEIQRLTILATMQDYIITQEILPIFLNKVGIEHVGKILIINLEVGIDLRLIEDIGSIADETFLFAEEDIFDSYIARGMSKNIRQVDIIGGKIAVPDNTFDAVVIIGYSTHDVLHDISNLDWAKDAYRTLSNDGLMVISTIQTVEQTNHFIVDSVIENLKVCHEIHEIDDGDLLKDMRKIGLKTPEIFEHKGLLLGHCRK